MLVAAAADHLDHDSRFDSKLEEGKERFIRAINGVDMLLTSDLLETIEI